MPEEVGADRELAVRAGELAIHLQRVNGPLRLADRGLGWLTLGGLDQALGLADHRTAQETGRASDGPDEGAAGGAGTGEGNGQLRFTLAGLPVADRSGRLGLEPPPADARIGQPGRWLHQPGRQRGGEALGRLQTLIEQAHRLAVGALPPGPSGRLVAPEDAALVVGGEVMVVGQRDHRARRWRPRPRRGRSRSRIAAARPCRLRRRWTGMVS